MPVTSLIMVRFSIRKKFWSPLPNDGRNNRETTETMTETTGETTVTSVAIRRWKMTNLWMPVIITSNSNWSDITSYVLVFTWKPCSVHLVTTLCPPDCVHVVTTWFPCGHNVVTTWKLHGFHVDTMWFPGGYHMVSNADITWFPYGNHILLTWTTHGFHMDTMWFLCGHNIPQKQNTALHEANWLSCLLFWYVFREIRPKLT